MRTEDGHTEQHHQHADAHRQEDALSTGEVQADVLEALGHGHKRDHEAGEEHVQRHEALGVAERLIGIDDQLLHAHEQAEGDQAGEERGDHPAGDDRADGAPSCTASIDTPTAAKPITAPMIEWVVDTGQPLAVATISQVPAASSADIMPSTIRSGEITVGVDDAVLDGLGHLAAGQVGAAELEDHGDQDRLLDGQRARADRGAHGVGHVVGAHAPGHEEAEQAGEYEEYEAVIRNKRHRRFLVDPRRNAGTQRASSCSRRLPTRSARSATSPIHSMIW